MLEFGEDEGVDLVSRPALVFDDRHGWSHRFGKCPVRFFFRPDCALINPCFQRANLIRGESVALGWHLVIRIFGRDALDEMALSALANDPKRFLRLTSARCVGFVVQSQAAFLFIRSVTFVATLDEDRLDVADEINLRLSFADGFMKQNCACQ